MVGRPREFDPEEALDAAMHAFWAKGYEATSLADLVAATRLHKGSLYQAFGDKHALFVQALKRYLREMRRHKNEVLKSAQTPLDGIRAVAHGMLDFADDTRGSPKGCMAINSLVELAPHDPDVEAIMRDHMKRMRTSMEDAVRQAQAAGQIDKAKSPELVTALMMTFMAGLAATLKGLITKEAARRLLDAQLQTLLAA